MKRSEFLKTIEDALEPTGIKILGVTDIEWRGPYNSVRNLTASQSRGHGMSAKFMLYVEENNAKKEMTEEKDKTAR